MVYQRRLDVSVLTDHDLGLQRLTQLQDYVEQSPSGRNEAMTRLQLVDTIFFECLGWQRQYDVLVEEHHAGEYADYIFITPHRSLVVEAKKQGQYFEVPTSHGDVVYSISSLLRGNPALDAALNQVATYCQRRGIPLAAVCNGHQLVAFVAVRSDGIPPLEGRALVFPSIDVMLEKFNRFWNSLSKLAVQQNQGSFPLLTEPRPSLPDKLSAHLPSYPGTHSRNVDQADIRTMANLIIEDVGRSDRDEVNFLKECYAQSGALPQYSLLAKAMLRNRYAALFDSRSPGPAIQPAVERAGFAQELIAESIARRPILLLGDVGVGKTMFIKHLMKVSAVEEFSRAYSIYIDFGTTGTLGADLRTHVIDAVEKQLHEAGVDVYERNFVRSVYWGELTRFRKGIHSVLYESDREAYQSKELEFLQEKIAKKDEHLRAALKQLESAQQRQVIVVLDNADQRDHKFQEEVFLISQEIAEHWPSIVFLSIRPETFHRSSRKGAFSGYHHKAFTIAPPRIDVVLKKRLQYALKIASGEVMLSFLKGTNTVLSLERVRLLLEIMHGSLQENRMLMEFIENASGGNVRRALDLIVTFLGSGHVDTGKIIERYESGNYIIPVHEFLRATLFGDRMYYDPDSSPIANLFDPEYPLSTAHFMVPTLLAVLDSLGRRSGDDDGFVPSDTVVAEMQQLGYTPEQVAMATVFSWHRQLIDSSGREEPKRGQPMPMSIRVTSNGAYHVHRLCRMFAYMDAMIVDTVVLDRVTRDALHDEQFIRPRLDRMEVFLSYLDRQWASFDQASFPFSWPDVSEDIRRELVDIRERIARREEFDRTGYRSG